MASTDESALLVIVGHGVDEIDWSADVRAVADALLADPSVRHCATSVAAAASGAPVDAPPFVGLVEATVGGAAAEVDTVVGRLETTLDAGRHLVLEADRRRIVTFERDWPLGEPSPGD